MANIELVIKIPEEIYNHTQEYEVGGFNQENDAKLFMAIKNGTPLPKGHGRLIDADKIVYHRCPDNVLDCPQSYDFTCQHCDFGIATKFRTDAIPTIIEADKESE